MIGTFFKRIGQDRRGVSAVEFALIAPLMLACYLGVSLLCSALLAERKASHVASAMGDLAAQSVTISKSDLTDICSIGFIIMSPYDTSVNSLKMRVGIVKEDANGNVTWGWNLPCQGMTQMSGAYTGPATALLAPNQSIIVSDVSYIYSSPLQNLNISWLPGARTFADSFHLQPRQSATVTCTDC